MTTDTEKFYQTIADLESGKVRVAEKVEATIEFYNNSSCTEMFISAEGMTKDGRFVVY